MDSINSSVGGTFKSLSVKKLRYMDITSPTSGVEEGLKILGFSSEDAWFVANPPHHHFRLAPQECIVPLVVSSLQSG